MAGPCDRCDLYDHTYYLCVERSFYFERSAIICDTCAYHLRMIIKDKNKHSFKLTKL